MDVYGIDVLIPATSAVLGFLLGAFVLRGGRHRRLIEELEVRVAEREGRIGQLEASRAELETRLTVAEEERAEATERLTDYQQEVVGHFSQTSDLLKAMTLQYRNIYQHLAQGAEALCPDDALRIETHAPIEGLAPAAGEELETEAEKPELASEELLPLDFDDAGAAAEAARHESPVQVDPRPEL